MQVLLAVDQSRDAQLAARFLKRVRLPRGAVLWMVHVAGIPYAVSRFPGKQRLLAAWRKDTAMRARRLIDRLAPPLRVQGIKVRLLVKEGSAGPVLLDTAERCRADLTVLGPHGHSRLMQFLLGSVSELFLNEAPTSVLIVRDWPPRSRDRGMGLVLTMDFSKDAKRAARFLSRLRLPPGSRVMVLHVEEREDPMLHRISGLGRIDLSQAVEREMHDRKRSTLAMLERLGNRFARQGLAVDHVFAQGDPAEEILRAAERHRADLIVMGSKGLTGLERYLLGSVSRKVARHASCSVLVVRSRRR